jgi:hypothetical protein
MLCCQFLLNGGKILCKVINMDSHILIFIIIIAIYSLYKYTHDKIEYYDDTKLKIPIGYELGDITRPYYDIIYDQDEDKNVNSSGAIPYYQPYFMNNNLAIPYYNYYQRYWWPADHRHKRANVRHNTYIHLPKINYTSTIH